MNASKLPPDRRDPDAVTEASERLAEIVHAAERAAASVIDDAEQQAQRVIEEAAERADHLVADRLRAIADELDHVAEPSPERPRLRTVEAVPEAPEPEAPTPRRAGEAGARLLATQMAVSGASRGEIEKRLRTGAGIEDPSALLDAILGPEE